jgi:DNA polymerase III psi subunit
MIVVDESWLLIRKGPLCRDWESGPEEPVSTGAGQRALSPVLKNFDANRNAASETRKIPSSLSR